MYYDRHVIVPGKIRKLILRLKKTWKSQGILEADWNDFSDIKHPFRNIRLVTSILCRKFSFQQPQQHRLVLLLGI